jgi:hypothetical protein
MPLKIGSKTVADSPSLAECSAKHNCCRGLDD